MSSTPRFVFFGTPYVARDTLAALVAAGYVPGLVVTSPDAPRGRGQQLAPCETKEWALAQGLTVETPERIDDAFIAKLASAGFDYAIVVAYGKILPQALIDIFPTGILNVHYSLLPKYRGASPVEEALLQGETETGVSIQKMVFALDAGDVFASRTIPILSEETTRELRPRLVAQGAQLLIEMLPAYLEGKLVGVAQAGEQATHSRRIRKEQGKLVLTDDAQKNWNTYRAYAESPGTYFFMHKDSEERRIKISTASYGAGVFTPVRVIPEGKGEMTYEDLLRSGWLPVSN